MANIARLLDTNQRKNFGSQIHGGIRGHTVATASGNYYKAGGNRSTLATLQAGRSHGNAGNVGKAPFNNGFASVPTATVYGKPNINAFSQTTNLMRTFNLPGGHTATAGSAVGGMKITKDARAINGNISKSLFNVVPATYTWDRALLYNGISSTFQNAETGNPTNTGLGQFAAAPQPAPGGGPDNAAGFVQNATGQTEVTGNILPNRLALSLKCFDEADLANPGVGAVIDAEVENNGSMVGDIGSVQANSSTVTNGILGWAGSQVPAYTEADIYGQEVNSSHVSQSMQGTSGRASLGGSGIKKDQNQLDNDGKFTRTGNVTANSRGVTAGRANDPTSAFVGTIITGLPSVSDPAAGNTLGSVGLWGSLRSNGNTGPGNQSNGLLKSVHASNFVVADLEELDNLISLSTSNDVETALKIAVTGGSVPSAVAAPLVPVGAAFDTLASDTAIFPGQ